MIGNQIRASDVGLEDHFIANYPKPDTLDTKVHWDIEKPKTCTYILKKIYKTPDNSTNQNYSQRIYKDMGRISYTIESPRRGFGDSLQLTNWILDSGETSHITSDISDFIQGPLVKQINISFKSLIISRIHY